MYFFTSFEKSRLTYNYLKFDHKFFYNSKQGSRTCTFGRNPSPYFHGVSNATNCSGKFFKVSELNGTGEDEKSAIIYRSGLIYTNLENGTICQAHKDFYGTEFFLQYIRPRGNRCL